MGKVFYLWHFKSGYFVVILVFVFEDVCEFVYLTASILVEGGFQNRVKLAGFWNQFSKAKKIFCLWLWHGGMLKIWLACTTLGTSGCSGTPRGRPRRPSRCRPSSRSRRWRCPPTGGGRRTRTSRRRWPPWTSGSASPSPGTPGPPERTPSRSQSLYSVHISNRGLKKWRCDLEN